MNRKIYNASLITALIAAAAAACSQAARAQSNEAGQAQPPASYTQADASKRADAYYEFTMGHLDEQMYDAAGHNDAVNDAIDHYQKAIALDPSAFTIRERLAETYDRAQRIRDAVTEAENVLKQDPNNLDAHRLLAHIYVRTLGDASETNNQKETIGLAVAQFKEILRVDPQDAEAALWLARLYRFQNQHDKAEEVLKGVLQNDPGNDAALDQLGQLYMDQGRVDEAITLLEPRADEGDPELLGLLGQAYTQQHEYAKAEKMYREAVDSEPDEPAHRRGLAQALLSQEKLDGALQQYERLAHMEPDSAENYLRMSQIYRDQGRLDLAEKNILLAKEHAPGNLEILYNEALIYEIEGRLDDAARILNDAVTNVRAQSDGSNDSALAILYELLGHVYRDQGNYPAAVRTFQELGKLGPEDDKHARMLVIETYSDARDMNSAIREVRDAITQYPDDESIEVTYALLLADKGQVDEGAKLLQPMLHGSTEDVSVYLDIAELYERGRKYSAAEQAALKAEGMATHKEDRENAWFMLGAIYEREGKYDLAEENFRKVLAQNPHNAPALNYLGYMLADRGIHLNEALALVQRALAEDPTNGAYLDSVGWAYFKQDKLSEAENYLHKASVRTVHDPTVLGHLGDLYAKLGQTERAADYWERAQSEWQKSLPANYEADRVAELDQKLKNVKPRLAQQKTSPSDTKQQ
jgi:tetratricopeptide (TPR) repeat protein